ncbi:MAG: hypothetical protein ACXAEI_20160 [Candidatus Hodarchaeales archaeon]|jgi:hypothetical protein
MRRLPNLLIPGILHEVLKDLLDQHADVRAPTFHNAYLPAWLLRLVLSFGLRTDQ